MSRTTKRNSTKHQAAQRGRRYEYDRLTNNKAHRQRVRRAVRLRLVRPTP